MTIVCGTDLSENAAHAEGRIDEVVRAARPLLLARLDGKGG